jgi:Transposase DDE domain group 1
VLADPRTGRNGRHSLIAQLRQSVFGRLAGYEDVNDADRLGRDPAMRWIVGGRAVTESAASTSQMGRFETSAMTTPTNLTALADLSGRWIDRAQARRARTALVLDIDSSVSPTYGAQEGTAYNGHFACTCYHPLFVFNQDGDLERCALRAGNVHSAHGWREVLDPVVARYRGQALRRLLRGDAAFALPDVYEYLEAERFGYAIRLPANQVLQNQIAHLLTRPVGRPPHYVRRFYASFRYQAPRPLHDLPDGRGRRATGAVRPHLGADREAAATRAGPMLTLEGCPGGPPGVELRPECVLGGPQSGRPALGGLRTPVAGATTAENPCPRGHKGGIQAQGRDGSRPSGTLGIRWAGAWDYAGPSKYR